MELLYCILIGYALGCINPAALICKIKKRDIRKEGTHNLGATNVTLVFGRGFGVFVMLFDILKSALAVILCRAIFGYAFALASYAALIGGVAAIAGHIFPFYLKFRGGKGLAPFGGLVLAYDPLMFVFLLLLTLVTIIIVNYSFVMPFAGGALFCLLATIKNPDIYTFLFSFIAGALIIWKHSSNLVKAKNKKDIKVRDYIKIHILKKEK